MLDSLPRSIRREYHCEMSQARGAADGRQDLHTFIGSFLRKRSNKIVVRTLVYPYVQAISGIYIS